MHYFCNIMRWAWTLLLPTLILATPNYSSTSTMTSLTMRKGASASKKEVPTPTKASTTTTTTKTTTSTRSFGWSILTSTATQSTLNLADDEDEYQYDELFYGSGEVPKSDDENDFVTESPYAGQGHCDCTIWKYEGCSKKSNKMT